MRSAMTAIAVVALLVTGAVLLPGCPGHHGSPAGFGAASRAALPPVKLLAYINVSSGCQEPTITLLQQLEDQHPDRVQLEIVDFGDEGEGEKRWKASDYDCMNIRINGSPFVRFPVGDKERIVAFQQPVGFSWTHEDLQAAVAAALDGKLEAVTEEEALAAQPEAQVDAKIVTEEVTRAGEKLARVLINERPAIVIQCAAGGKQPLQRAEAAAAVLRKWLSQPVAPNQIDRVEAEGGWAVRVNKQVVVVATPGDAKAANGSTDQMAKKWLVGIRQGVAIAARPNAGGGEAPGDTGCETGG